jgi:hypothetical protein
VTLARLRHFCRTQRRLLRRLADLIAYQITRRIEHPLVREFSHFLCLAMVLLTFNGLQFRRLHSEMRAPCLSNRFWITHLITRRLARLISYTGRRLSRRHACRITRCIGLLFSCLCRRQSLRVARQISPRIGDPLVCDLSHFFRYSMASPTICALQFLSIAFPTICALYGWSN